MDITFNCPHCKTEMVSDSTGSGSEVNCPACGKAITIPEAEAPVHTLNPIDSSAAMREHKHYSVPVHDAPSEPLIQKPNLPLEVAAKVGDRKLRIKSIRRADCMEVGHDKFDDRVTEFLQKLGEENIVSINTLAYTHLDLGTKQLLTDYGVMVVYKG